MLRITLAQLNLTIGDIEGNAARMIEVAESAARTGTQLLVFPELSLTGYYPADLLEEPGFLARVDQALHRLIAACANTPGMVWLVGTPLRRQGPGKPLFNALLALEGGKVQLHYAKQLLPTYNVFDERRHFEPGPDTAPVLRVGGYRVGVLICEDGWNDNAATYAVNPMERLAQAAPDLVVSINASPSNRGKRRQRHAVLGAASARHQLPLLYVNTVGGHDQIVFDGASFALGSDGQLCWEAPAFSEAVVELGFEAGRIIPPGGSAPGPAPALDQDHSSFYRSQIVLGLRDYARRCGFKQAVVGCSGGIDSALTLALAVEALGPEHVSAITMPSVFSSVGSVEDSHALCKELGIELLQHPIASTVQSHADQFQHSFGQPLAGLALENLQARIRGTVLMAYSNTLGHLLLTTGNKSEISVGYCTLYGDTNGGLGLIGDLYKTEVFALSRHINASAGRAIIPWAIINKEPSAELAPGQRDIDSLPPYEVLDEILKFHIEGPALEPDEFEQARAFCATLEAQAEGRQTVARVRQMVARSEYKRRQAPPIIRVRARAFGVGRQMPIAARLIA
jgi:NAD+ synthase (glutamine-hydrolysing)